MSMKKIVFFIILAIILVPSLVLAGAWQEEITVAANEVVDRNLVRVARTINIAGQVEGDVIVAAAELIISGRVGGDVIAAAADIKITGQVEGNIRVVGNNVNISAKVGKNLNIFGANLVIDDQADIGWSLLFAGTKVEVKGLVGGHLDGIADQANLYSEIGGDAYVELGSRGKLTVFGDSEIGGTLTYRAARENQLIIKTGADISKQKFLQGKGYEINWESLVGFGSSFYYFIKVVQLFGLLVVGLILLALFKKKLFNVTEIMLKKSGLCMGWGAVYLVVIPIIIILLLFTVIGIPMAIILGFIYGLALYLTKIFVSLFIGQKILEFLKKGKQYSILGALALGLVIYLMLVRISYIGWLFSLVSLVWVLGAFGELLKKRNQKEGK